MVAGFIALLNVALIMAVLGQTPTLPFSGVTEVTVGGVPGEPAAAAFCLSGSLHPMAKMRSRNAVNRILLLLCLCMIILPFLWGQFVPDGTTEHLVFGDFSRQPDRWAVVWRATQVIHSLL